MALTDDYDPTTSLDVYHPNRTTSARARHWTVEKLAHDLQALGALSFFEGPGTDATAITGYASTKLWLQSELGVTSTPGTVRAYTGSGDASDILNWPALTSARLLTHMGGIGAGSSAAGYANVDDYGAVGDGVTDDSAAFTSALAASNVVVGSPGKTYAIKEVSVGENKVLDLHGCFVVPVANALYAVRLTGYRPRLRGFRCSDNGNATRETTTSSSAASGATVLPVTSATGISAGIRLFVRLTNGNWHHSRVASVAGNNITLDSELPSGCSSGATVYSSFGLINVNDAEWFAIEDTLITNGYVCIVVENSSGSTDTKRGAINGFYADSMRVGGVIIGRNAHNISGTDWQVWGGWTKTFNYTGDGSTTQYSFGPDFISLNRDVTITVDAVAQVLTTDYTINSDTTINFNSPPANNAAIVINHYASAAVALAIDQKTWSVEHSAFFFTRTLLLKCHHGLHCRDVTLADFRGVVTDTMQLTCCWLEDSDKNKLPYFNGWAPTCIKLTNATNTYAGDIYTDVTPSAQIYGGGTGVAFDIDADSEIWLAQGSWWGPSYAMTVATGAEVYFKTRDALHGGTNSNIAASSTVYIGAVGHDAVESSGSFLAPKSGYAYGYYYESVQAPGAGETFTYTLRVAGTDTTIIGTTTGASSFGGVVSGEQVRFDAGDRVSVKLVTSSSATATGHRIAINVAYFSD